MSTSILNLINLNIINNDKTQFNINTNDLNEVNQICSELYTSDDLVHRVRILNFLYKNNEELCIEHYHKINVQYMYNPNIEMNEQMLIKIIKESELPIELKYESAKLIHLESINRENDKENEEINKEKINQSLDLLLHIASKENIEEIHSLIRVQILQSLIESERNMEKVKELLYQFLTDESLEQYYRYKIVLKFSDNPNTQKEYIIEIFKMICLSRIFRTRYTILASQFFLGNEKLFIIEERLEVENMIISFCQDQDLDYELRADAADLILTQGLTERNRQIAMDTIITLGQETGYRCPVTSIYNNRQNVHNSKIDESVKEMIQYIASIQLNTKEGVYITYDDVCNEIIKEYCSLNNIELNDEIKKFKDFDSNQEEKNNEIVNDFERNVRRTTEGSSQTIDDDDYTITEKKPNIELIKASLLRFSLDRGLYSNFQSIQSLVIKIWQIIKEHEYRETLTQRLFEELIEMSGSCSSGHISRLVNVLSGFEINGKLMKLTIDYKDEMTSVMMAKINKKISEIGLTGKEEDASSVMSNDSVADEEYQNSILEEMMWTSNFERRINFNRFFRENVIQIRDELFREYIIEQKLMDVEIFEINFRNILQKFEY